MEAAKHHKHTFGAALYFNGVHINGKMTLKKHGWFKGFKKGDGQYNEFLFQLEDFGTEEQKPDNAQSQKPEDDILKTHSTRAQELR